MGSFLAEFIQCLNNTKYFSAKVKKVVHPSANSATYTSFTLTMHKIKKRKSCNVKWNKKDIVCVHCLCFMLSLMGRKMLHSKKTRFIPQKRRERRKKSFFCYE